MDAVHFAYFTCYNCVSSRQRIEREDLLHILEIECNWNLELSTDQIMASLHDNPMTYLPLYRSRSRRCCMRVAAAVPMEEVERWASANHADEINQALSWYSDWIMSAEGIPERKSTSMRVELNYGCRHVVLYCNEYKKNLEEIEYFLSQLSSEVIPEWDGRVSLQRDIPKDIAMDEWATSKSNSAESQVFWVDELDISRRRPGENLSQWLGTDHHIVCWLSFMSGSPGLQVYTPNVNGREGVFREPAPLAEV